MFCNLLFYLLVNLVLIDFLRLLFRIYVIERELMSMDTVLVSILIVFICYNVCRELLTTSTGTVCPLRIDTVLVSIVWLCLLT